jgi:hypothetical protein
MGEDLRARQRKKEPENPDSSLVSSFFDPIFTIEMSWVEDFMVKKSMGVGGTM